MFNKFAAIKKIIGNINSSPFSRAAMILIPLILFFLLLLRWVTVGQLNSAVSQMQISQLRSLGELSAALMSESLLNDKSQRFDEIVLGLQNHSLISDVYVVNEFAGIIAPSTRAFDIVDEKSVEKILTQNIKKTLIEFGEQYTTSYTPVIIGKNVKGVLKLTSYHLSTKVKLFSFWICLILFVVVIIVMIAISIVIHLWNRPWEDLHMAINHALENHSDPKPPEESSETLEQHWTLYRRLLSKLRHQK